MFEAFLAELSDLELEVNSESADYYKNFWARLLQISIYHNATVEVLSFLIVFHSIDLRKLKAPVQEPANQHFRLGENCIFD